MQIATFFGRKDMRSVIAILLLLFASTASAQSVSITAQGGFRCPVFVDGVELPAPTPSQVHTAASAAVNEVLKNPAAQVEIRCNNVYRVSISGWVPPPTQQPPTPGTGSITLAWDAVSVATGYKIHFGLASGQYDNHLDVGNVTTKTLTGIGAGVDVFFAVTAYNASAESGYSNEVSAQAQ